MFYGAFPPEFNSGRMYSGSRLGVDGGRRGGLGESGHRITVHRVLVLVGDLEPDQRALGRSVVPCHGEPRSPRTWPGCRTTAAQAAQTATQATKAASAYERRSPQHVPPPVIADNRGPTGEAGGDQPLRAEHRGDRGQRGPVLRNVGPGCPGDGHLLRLLGDRREQLDPVQPAPQTTNTAPRRCKRPR